MIVRFWAAGILVTAGLIAYGASNRAPACCPAPGNGQSVVNADQTVVIIWDANAKMQHFIRRASFKTDAADFGFLVPSPSQPELAESGNEAFPRFLKLTEPEIKWVTMPTPPPSREVKKSEPKDMAVKEFVKVLEQKLVAGFNATVLETNSTVALVGWLKDNGYAFSPQVEAWAKPYVDAGWKITALKVAKSKDSANQKSVQAAALRMSFKTDRPLFPYREPDTKSAADLLGAKRRLLRIYFVAEARYKGELTKEHPWSGTVAWAGKVDDADRKKLLELLKLPQTTGPAQWWLTEFEDNWPYEVAPADVSFAPDANQADVRRPPIIQYRYGSSPAEVNEKRPGNARLASKQVEEWVYWAAGAGGTAVVLVLAVAIVVLRSSGRKA
jgi:hypothetical protein